MKRSAGNLRDNNIRALGNEREWSINTVKTGGKMIWRDQLSQLYLIYPAQKQ
ncbi:MAG: hypothetical protein Q7J84_01315 [Sulfuricaulis sp.]|nr:hypothetical protein [Sulfuricaulis sp.]